VLDDGAAGSESPWVAGLSQDRCRADRRDPGDRGDQTGEPELAEDRGHPQLNLADPLAGEIPVLQQESNPLERARTMRDDPGRIGQCGKHIADYAQARFVSAAASYLPPHHMLEPGHAQPPGADQVTAASKTAGHAHSSGPASAAPGRRPR
jgi:hypothetical protein